MSWRDRLPKPPDQFDPTDAEQVESLLKLYDVEIEADNNPTYPGWGVLYKGGGGIMCPFLKDDSDGSRARAIIALSIYLHRTGVEAGLCDTLAYWFIQGPYLSPRKYKKVLLLASHEASQRMNLRWQECVSTFQDSSGQWLIELDKEPSLWSDPKRPASGDKCILRDCFSGRESMRGTFEECKAHAERHAKAPPKKAEIVAILENITKEEAQEKCQQIFNANKNNFKELKIDLFAGDFLPTN